MNYCNDPSVPCTGWNCERVLDVGDDEQSTDEREYEVCQMCGNERIRYVHVMSHPFFPDELNVGCICAGKMTCDFSTPRLKEKELRNRCKRRKNLLVRTWRVSSKVNDFLNVNGKNVVVYVYNFNKSKWGYGIDRKFNRERFNSKELAKLAAFNEVDV